MELLETLWRIAQNHGPWMALGAAAAILLARFTFKKYFGKKEKDAATREDVERLLLQLEANSREVQMIKAQLTRVHWLAQQQWQHGRCAARTIATHVEGGASS